METTHNSGHTPGPWHASDRGTGWEIHHVSEYSSAMCWDGVKGCEGPLPAGMRTDVANEADARLIAAAPDLLAALLDVAYDMEDGDCWCADRLMDEDHDAERLAARAAVAKAKSLAAFPTEKGVVQSVEGTTEGEL